jgi:hypothetical protein
MVMRDLAKIEIRVRSSVVAPCEQNVVGDVLVFHTRKSGSIPDARSKFTPHLEKKGNVLGVMSANVMVLNCDFQQLGLTKIFRALNLVRCGRAEVIKSRGKMTSMKLIERVPTMIRLLVMVTFRGRKAVLTNRNGATLRLVSIAALRAGS